jgi:hypothetical protein
MKLLKLYIKNYILNIYILKLLCFWTLYIYINWAVEELSVKIVVRDGIVYSRIFRLKFRHTLRLLNAIFVILYIAVLWWPKRVERGEHKKCVEYFGPRRRWPPCESRRHGCVCLIELRCETVGWNVLSQHTFWLTRLWNFGFHKSGTLLFQPNKNKLKDILLHGVQSVDNFCVWTILTKFKIRQTSCNVGSLSIRYCFETCYVKCNKPTELTDKRTVLYMFNKERAKVKLLFWSPVIFK